MVSTWLSDTFGGGGAAAPGVTLTPQQNLDNLLQLYNSPIGQDYKQSVQDTNALNVKQILAQIETQRKQLELQQGTQAANEWAQKQQVQLAQQQHELAVQTLATNSTGYYDGSPTLARQQFESGTTGYYNGAPTLAREQAASSTALQAAQLGASLRGPADWGAYLRATGGLAGGPVASLASSAPSGLGMSNPNYQSQTPTIASILGDAGIGGGGAGAAPNDTNAMLARYGLTPEQGAQVKGYMDNPNTAPGGWWEGKSTDEKGLLSGLYSTIWGGSPQTFQDRYSSTRVNQGNALAA